MTKKFIFNGTEYSSEMLLREAVFKATRKAFGKPKTEADWAKLGIKVVETESEMTERQIAARELANAKRQRRVAVATITVEVDGMVFDGDETSQDRMARSIVAMTDNDLIPWVLSDDSVAQVNKEQLTKALRLSGLKQAELWVLPYKG